MAITQIYIDPAINAASGAGTIGSPYGDLQHALNTVTRNATDGDIFNVKAGTSEILAAALSLATYGAPTQAAPLIIRGYTSTAADGGQGVIDGAATYSIINLATTDNLWLVDMRLTNVGANNLFLARNSCKAIHCEFDTGTGHGINLGTGALVMNCHVDMACAISRTPVLISTGSVLYNYVRATALVNTAAIVALNNDATVRGNIVNTNLNGINTSTGDRVVVDGNTVFSVASTGKGINADTAALGYESIIINNYVEGFSGAGGVGYSLVGQCISHSNAAYNCTTAYTTSSLLGDVNNDITSGSALVNAGSEDYDINGTVTGVTEDGYPSSIPGTASTAPKPDKGAVQSGAGSSGGMGGIFGSIVR